jgi:hypothetical protein
MSTPPPAAPLTSVPPTNPLAIVSLVLSLIGLGTFVTAIGGVITGHVALGQIKKTGQGGRSLALAGVVIGYIVIVLGIGLLALFFGGVLFYFSFGK